MLSVAAVFAQGETRITGVRELRTKESDRIAAIERLLSAAGIQVESLPNGIAIHGGTPRCDGAVVETRKDATELSAQASDGEASIDVSFPAFIPSLRKAQE